MDFIFNIGEAPVRRQLDIDSLYEHKKNRDLSTLHTYNLVLGRVHSKIKAVSRVRDNAECCWYLVPEMILGLPKFDSGTCIAYLIHQLKANGFLVRYTHPNLLFIAWNHWTPDYVRAEFKKRTGIIIDGLGNRKAPVARAPAPSVGTKKKCPITATKDISSYSPTGKLLYSTAQLPKIKLAP